MSGREVGRHLLYSGTITADNLITIVTKYQSYLNGLYPVSKVMITFLGSHLCETIQSRLLNESFLNENCRLRLEDLTTYVGLLNVTNSFIIFWFKFQSSVVIVLNVSIEPCPTVGQLWAVQLDKERLSEKLPKYW